MLNPVVSSVEGMFWVPVCDAGIVNVPFITVPRLLTTVVVATTVEVPIAALLEVPKWSSTGEVFVGLIVIPGGSVNSSERMDSGVPDRMLVIVSKTTAVAVSRSAEICVGATTSS